MIASFGRMLAVMVSAAAGAVAPAADFVRVSANRDGTDWLKGGMWTVEIIPWTILPAKFAIISVIG